MTKIEAEQPSLDKDLFSITLSRIIRVINCNFFKDFFLLELLSLTQVHAGQLPPLGFNSCGDSLPDVKQQGRQANIFAFMASNKPKLQKSEISSSKSASKLDVKRISKVPDIAVSKPKIESTS